MTPSFRKSFSTLYSDELLFGVHVCFHVFFCFVLFCLFFLLEGGGEGGGENFQSSPSSL